MTDAELQAIKTSLAALVKSSPDVKIAAQAVTIEMLVNWVELLRAHLAAVPVNDIRTVMRLADTAWGDNDIYAAYESVGAWIDSLNLDTLVVNGEEWPDVDVRTPMAGTLIPAQGPGKRIIVDFIKRDTIVATWTNNADRNLTGIAIEDPELIGCEIRWHVEDVEVQP